jgi:hypothetical protein
MRSTGSATYVEIVMARYKPGDLGPRLLPVVFDDQIQPGTFEYALDYLIDQLDLSGLDAKFKNDRTGAPAYDPRVMLKIVPLAGDVMKESGGCRKVRWARSGMGKSGGARVIYFTRLSEGEICVLVAYPKSVRATIPGPILRQTRKELEIGNKVKDQTKG